jgi:hypothetical protein
MRKFWDVPHLRLDTGGPSGYLDPQPQLISRQNPYLELQRFFSDHLDRQVKNLRVTGACRYTYNNEYPEVPVSKPTGK